VRQVHAWIDRRFAMGTSWTLGELLIAAEEDGLSFLERQCIAYALYRSYPESETLFSRYGCRGRRPICGDVAQGDDLRFGTRSTS